LRKEVEIETEKQKNIKSIEIGRKEERERK